MAKEVMEKSVKKSNRKLRRTILGTLSGIFMISAIIVALVPVKPSQASDPSDPVGEWTEAYDAHPDYDSSSNTGVIPDYSSAKTYFSEDGLFGIAGVMRTGSAETAGVLVYYDNQSSYASSNLVIPDGVSCFLYNSAYKLQAVDSNDEFLYYVAQEAIVSDNNLVISDAVYGECLASDSASWKGKQLYRYDGSDYVADEQLSLNVRYIGSKRYEVLNDYKLHPASDGSGVFEGARNFSSVVIPEHILAIGNNAFKSCQMSSVSIANKVVSIGNHAFEGCNRLSTVTLANNTDLTEIGSYAFANCVYLTSITIPDQVVQIGSGCFMNCTSLSAANLYGSNQDGNANLVHIGDGLFYNCSSLGQLYLPNQLDPANVSAMKYLLYGCTNLKTLGLSINGGNLTYTNVTGCSNLLRVEVPNRDTKFDCTFATSSSGTKNGYKHADASNKDKINQAVQCTFGAENLGSFSPFNDYEVDDRFTIVAYRNSNAYVYACEHEYSVGYLDDGYQGQYERVKNNYFFTVNEQNELIHFGLYKENGDASIVEIPEAVGNHSINAIDSDTFSSFDKNDEIKYVYIPSSVKDISAGAFDGCTDLQVVEFGNALNVDTIGEAAFKTQTDKDIPLRFIGSISPDSEPFNYAMKSENNYNASSATTKYISYTSEFPTNLEVELVVEKDPVTNTIIGTTPTLISAPTFDQFSGQSEYSLLRSVNPDEANEQNALVASAYQKYLSAGEPTEDEQAVIDAVVRATVPNGIEGLNADVYQGRGYLASVVLNSVTEVPDEAFKDCTKLQTFIMRSSGKEGGEKIGNHVFENDNQLTSVSLPETLTEMGSIPFYNCSALTSVGLDGNPKFSCSENGIIYQINDDGNKTVIECLQARGNLFGTGKIREDEFADVTEIRPSAFRGCSNVSQVYFGDADIKAIPEYCFADCTKLNYCEVSDKTESIGDFAFLNTALSDIRIPSSVVLIPENAFTEGTEDNYTMLKGLNIQCEVPSAAYTFATKYGFGTEDRIPHPYYVQFYDNDNNPLGDIQKVYEGEDAVPPEPPAVSGMTFEKWQPDYTNVTADLKIYPKYVPSTDVDNRPVYTVRFFNYEGTLAIKTQKVKEGDSATPPNTTPEREGFTFTGWLPEYDNIISDLDVYPQFKASSSDKDNNGSDNNNGSNNNNGTNNNGSDNNTANNNGTNNNGTNNNGANNNGTNNTNPATPNQTMTPNTNTNTGTTGKGNTTTTGTGTNNGSTTTGGSNTTTTTGTANTTTTAGSNTNVVVSKSGIANSGLVSANVNGSTDDFVLKISDSDSAKAAVEQALLNEYGSLDDIRYFAMDISLYDKTGTSKIQNLDNVSVTVTMPIPDALASYGGNNKAGAVINGDTLEKLDARFTTIDGVPCISFVATHFSPYTVYVDLNNLSASLNGTDVTPTTGDPIHPKWFLSIGLFLMSVLLFFLKGSKKKVIKVLPM